jgi:4-amino-4-deoxy-L-arabinose transferase-like glycosyltransferase
LGGAATEPHQSDMSDLAFAGGLLSIFALGCAVRFYGLSELPLWMDEAHSYFTSTRPLTDILFNKVDVHPPLFYVVQHFWTLIDPNIAAFRVPVAAVGSVTVLIIALATSDLVNRRAGLTAGALLALSTGHIYFSQDARMYPLLAFGLALATWGLVGFVDRNGRKLYLAIYLVGGLIAIYSQIIGLIYLAILNATTLCSALLNGMKDRIFLWGLTVNVVLLVFSLPWLLSIPEAVEIFHALPQERVALIQWFFRNIVGLPGIPLPFKIAADAFMLLVFVIGAVFAYRSARRTFAAVAISLLAIYPLALGVLNLFTPILANRTFIPCVIPASMLCGAAVALLKRPVAQAVLLAAVLLLAAWSEVETYRLRVKPEDMPQALALVDANGFAGAPVLTCQGTAITAYLYAPDRPIFFLGAADELIRFNDRMLESFSLPQAERTQMNGVAMRNFLLKNDLIIDPAAAWSSVKRMVLITTSCGPDMVISLEHLLVCLGFRKIDSPSLTRPSRVVIESLWTKLSLWVAIGGKAQGEGRCKIAPHS